MGLSESRRALVVRGIVRSNGDNTALVFHEGVLARARHSVPASLVATDRAVHVIDNRTREAAVCSYNRLVRFDDRDDGSDVLVGLVCYMGSTPTAERIASGAHLLPSELASYCLRLPRKGRWEQVRAKIEAGMAAGGIPASLHHVEAFV